MLKGIEGVKGIMEKWKNGKSEECDVKNGFFCELICIFVIA